MSPQPPAPRPQPQSGVFAVPPLARRRDSARSIDWDENARIRTHILVGGVTRLMYGGNAFLYHITLDEYRELLGWLTAGPAEAVPIPSLGPSFGRAMDQAAELARHRFSCAMLLPCGDPRDAGGLERGAREIVQRAGTPLVLYLKDTGGWGPDERRGLDAVGRLMADGVAVAIKYAVVRDNPAVDPYLDALVARVDRARIISGWGERPAVVHLQQWGLPGFTTGSGCLNPAGSQALLEACGRKDFDEARRIRERFLPFEDLRDLWGPARVLHAGVELAGIAATGAIPPYVSELDEEQVRQLAPVARALAGR